MAQLGAHLVVLFDRGDGWLGNALHFVVMVFCGLALSGVAIYLYPFGAGRDLIAGSLCGMIGLVAGDWIFNRVWDRYNQLEAAALRC